MACSNPDDACNQGSNNGMQINRDWLPVAKVKAGGTSGKITIYVGALMCGPKQFGEFHRFRAHPHLAFAFAVFFFDVCRHLKQVASLEWALYPFVLCNLRCNLL